MLEMLRLKTIICADSAKSILFISHFAAFRLKKILIKQIYNYCKLSNIFR
jgi:hypothetical protein